jgi:hypothetical protein
LIETPPFRPNYPDFQSVVVMTLGAKAPGVPSCVALPRTRYNGPAYLGPGLDPLIVSADPNAPGFRVPGLALADEARPRFGERLGLLESFDRMRHDLDTTGTAVAMDRFGRKAVNLLTADATRKAFAIESEDPKVRDRYGRHTVGQQCLLARRLIEAGVRLVSVDFPCVPGQKAFSWDDHASVWNIFEQMKIRLPVLDQVVSALIEDIHDRGLQDDVLLVVMAMSHTPKLSNFRGQPGEHGRGRCRSCCPAGCRWGRSSARPTTGRGARTRPVTRRCAGDVVSVPGRAAGTQLWTTGRRRHCCRGRPIAELVGSIPDEAVASSASTDSKAARLRCFRFFGIMRSCRPPRAAPRG